MRALAAWLLLLQLGAAAWAEDVSSSNGNTATPSGSFTAGDLVCGAGGAVIQDCSSYMAPAIIPKGVQFTNNIVYSGAYSINQQWLSVNALTLTGTVTTPGGDALIAPFHIYVSGDSTDTTTSGNGNLNVFAVNHATSTGSTGGRCIICGSENIVGTPTTLSAAGYISVSGVTRVSANLGGATGVYGNYKGGTFAGGFNIFTTTGATFVSLVNAQENDVTLATGSSAAEKHGLTIIQGSNDAVRAVYDDNAIQISAQDGTSTTWLTGIMFGAYAHKWSFGTDSTLIGAQIRQAGAASPSVALNGVDWTNVTFSGNPFIAPLSSVSKVAYAAAGNQGTGIYFPNANQIAIVGNGVTGLTINGAGAGSMPISLQIGSGAAATISTGELALAKISATGTAPAAGFLKMEAVAGTNAGTCKVIAYAGTSTTPVTIVDNVGGSC